MFPFTADFECSECLAFQGEILHILTLGSSVFLSETKLQKWVLVGFIFYFFLPIWKFLLSFPLTDITPAALSVSVNLRLASQKQMYMKTTFDVDGGLMHQEFQLYIDGSERGFSV